jgi:tetratricopeptide (TPR) repeat protein
MPLGNPEKSFEAAVRHLFRHLHNANALRRNPLVRSFFRVQGGGNSDHLALASLRTALLRLARACHSQDSSHGQSVRADRQLAIITAIYARPHSNVSVAHDLAISLRQYYRDRRLICQRVARLIASYKSAAATASQVYDPLRLTLRRAANLVDSGRARAAVTELERAAREASEDFAKVHALADLSSAIMALGEVERAADTIETARNLMKRETKPGSEAVLLAEKLQLAQYRVAKATGRYEVASHILSALANQADARVSSNAGSDELDLAILLEACQQSCLEGRFADARAELARCELVGRRLDHIPTEHRVALALMAAESGGDAVFSPDERLARLQDALNLSLSVGSAMGTLFASLGLSNHYAYLGYDDHARAFAHRAFKMADDIDGKEAVVLASVSAANALLQTVHWRTLDPRLFDVEPFVRPGTLEWTWLKLFQGVLLKRLGRRPEALVALLDAESSASTLDNRRFHSAVLRELSLLLHDIGRTAESLDFIRRAVDLGERGASALSLYMTYRAAAHILKDDRLSRLARGMRAAIRGIENCPT